MPLGQSQDIPQAGPGGRVTPRFWHHLIRFRHFIDGSLALASLNRACRNLVPAFPQRSLPSLLTTAACGGLRSAPDCRPRRAFLHLSYSYASPFGPAILVTQDHSGPWQPSHGVPVQGLLDHLVNACNRVDHSGSPAFWRPSSYLARSSGRYGPNASLRLDMRSSGASWRNLVTTFFASYICPASALLAAVMRNNVSCVEWISGCSRNAIS